jgi:2-polyprenyl-6-methoxyphenol hydroxylase-like FAD-dependent oxidoreductase
MSRPLRLIVNGSGAAGVSAALTAADAGLDVVLLARQSCYLKGGYEPLQSVHPGLETVLNSFGCGQAIRKSSKSVYEGIWSAGKYMPLSPVKGETWYGHHIDREIFDKELLRQAGIHPNIQITDGGKVTKFYNSGSELSIQLNSGRRYEADYMIDASGRSRSIGKLLGKPEEFYSPRITAWSGVSGADTEVPREFAGFYPDKTGWTWIARETNSKFSWTRLSLTAEKVRPSFAADLRYIRSANMRWRIFKTVAEGRLLLAGDAAGVLDPGAGQGILNACYSGVMAATSLKMIVAGEMRQDYALRAYDEWFRGHYFQNVKKLKAYYQNLNIVFNT